MTKENILRINDATMQFGGVVAVNNLSGKSGFPVIPNFLRNTKEEFCHIGMESSIVPSQSNIAPLTSKIIFAPIRKKSAKESLKLLP